jgi:ATP-dependent DNA ligase
MLLLATSSLPDNDDWLYELELELDGYRAIGFKSGGRVQLRAFRQQIHRSLRERSPKSTVFSAAA